MPTPGQIATDMQQALRDLEAALRRLSVALGLAPYEPPAIRHHDRAYVDMVRTRSLADWLQGVVDALDGTLTDANNAVAAAEAASAQASALRATLEQTLALLTKAQLIELGGSLGVEGLSDGQRKEELIAVLIAAVMATQQSAIWRTPEEFAAMQRIELAPVTLDVMRPVVEHLLNALTKTQLLEMAVDFAVEGLSDHQRKDELVAALANNLLAPALPAEPEPPDEPET